MQFDIERMIKHPEISEDIKHIYDGIRLQLDDSVAAARTHLSKIERQTDPAIVGDIHHNLACILYDYYHQFGRISRLQESIEHFRTARSLQASATPERCADILDSLGAALCALCMHDFEAVSLDEVALLHDDSMNLRVAHGINPSRSLCGRGAVLVLRAREGFCDGNANDFYREAAPLLWKAVEESQDLRYKTQALYHLWRATRWSGSETLSRLLAITRQASDVVPIGHVEYIRSREVLAQVLRKLGDWIYDEALLQESLDIFRTTSSLACFLQHPLRVELLSGMCREIPRSTREVIGGIHQIGQLLSTHAWIHPHMISDFVGCLGSAYASTLDIRLVEEMLRMLRDSHRNLPRGCTPSRPSLHNLASTLLDRFQSMGRIDDLDEARCISHQILPPSTPTDGDIFYCAGFAELSLARFSVLKQLEDVEAAIKILRECLPLLPKNPESMSFNAIHSSVILQLVDALHARYTVLDDPADLEEGAQLIREVLKCRISLSHHKAEILDVLCKVLRSMAIRTSKVGYVLEALSLHEQALALLPAPDSDAMRARLLAGLAGDEHVLWRITSSTANFDRSMQLYAESAAHAESPAHARLGYAQEWIIAAKAGSHRDSSDSGGALLAAYASAVSLLPQVASLGLEFRARLDALRHAPGLANDAALHAISCQELAKAVSLLEAGRAVFWSRALQVRCPLDGLPEEMQARFKFLTRELHQSSPVTDESILGRRRLSEEFERLASQAQQLPGYEHFLAGYSYDELRSAAMNGPVVVLLADSHVAKALIIRSSDTVVECLDLPVVNSNSLRMISDSLHTVNMRSREGMRDANSAIDDLASMRKMEKAQMQRSNSPGPVLRTLWETVVAPIITALGFSKADDDNYGQRPRIWWCPTGAFSFLPLHAAGIHHGSVQVCTLDYVVSSYIPTLSTLLRAQRDPPRCSRSDAEVLTLAVPDVPGYMTLPNTASEISRIHSILSSSSGPLVRDVDGTLPIDQILASVSSASVLHLACHGQQDQREPLESGFILYEGRLTVTRLMNATSERASFAFLSACETAKGDEQLADEAVHLASAMMFAGFRSVIGTMWSMDDADGPDVAEAVYKALFREKDGELDYEAIPRALDAAVRRLRQKGVHPSRWATYVHMGI